MTVMYIHAYCSFESLSFWRKKISYPLDKVVYVKLLLLLISYVI